MTDWQEHIDVAALGDWMDGQGLESGAIENATQLAGGTQNVLLKFDRGGRSFVLRRPPPHPRANSNETMRREARVLAALKGTDVPHPGLIAACPEEDVLGVAFYLMEPVDGFNPSTGLLAPHKEDPALRHRIGLSMAEGIAALGSIDYQAVGLDGLGKPEGYLERQVPRWKAQLESYEKFPKWEGRKEIPGIEDVADWLEANLPDDFQPGIIHGDFHLSNVMIAPDSGELAAIVDWELTTIGDPLLDLGWLMATWPEPDVAHDVGVGTDIEPWDGFATIEEIIAHYGKHSTRSLEHITWYGVLGCYKLGIILEGSHARATEGKTPQHIGDRLHAHTIALFRRALRMIEKQG